MSEVIKFQNFEGRTGLLAGQELRAALAVCSGLSNKQIAKTLGCAPGTVKKTIERIFFKFRVSSRAALVAKAFALGLISFACPTNPTPENHQGDSQHDGVLIA
ncbi:MAG TPA: helix-turn-helix transcriptional regulator [Pseudomonas sp.]|uniref:response regulator transcription factor n=1 Tax=Pseudomonas sp. TaxID=306 RepID=UPI002ED7B9D4